MSNIDKSINRAYKIYDCLKTLRHRVVFESDFKKEIEIENDLAKFYSVLVAYNNKINKIIDDLDNCYYFPDIKKQQHVIATFRNGTIIKKCDCHTDDNKMDVCKNT